MPWTRGTGRGVALAPGAPPLVVAIATARPGPCGAAAGATCPSAAPSRPRAQWRERAHVHVLRGPRARALGQELRHLVLLCPPREEPAGEPLVARLGGPLVAHQKTSARSGSSRRDLALLRPKVAAPDALVVAGECGRLPQPAQLARAGLGPGLRAGRCAGRAYDGRHTYASLLIHEGRSPLLVAAALGHAGGELVWRRYAHVLDEARLAPAVGMVEAIEQARAECERAGLRPGCSQAPVRVLRAVRPA